LSIVYEYWQYLLGYRDSYFQKAKENMKNVKTAYMITIGNKVLKLYFYIIHAQSQEDMLSFEWWQ